MVGRKREGGMCWLVAERLVELLALGPTRPPWQIACHPHATPRISSFNTADCLPHLNQRPFGRRSVRFGAHLRPLGQRGGGPARDDGARFASRRITDAACRGWIHGLVASNRRVCGMAGTYLPRPRNCVCRHRPHCLGMSSIAL
jgi:hypothetical protein